MNGPLTTRLVAVATLAWAIACPAFGQGQPAAPAAPAKPAEAQKPHAIIPEEAKGKVIPYPVPSATLDPNHAPGIPGQAGTPQALPEGISIAEKSFEWGDIADTDPVEHIINFKNVSDKKIKVSATASCGCTVTTMDKNEFNPGEEGKVTARFDPHGRAGSQSKVITFSILDPPNTFGMQTVTLSANVKALIMYDPPRLFSTGVYTHREGKVEKLMIKGRKPGFAITKTECPSDFVKVKVLESKQVDEGGDKFTVVPVELLIGKGATIGKFDASVVFTSNDERARPQPYFLGADVEGDTKVTPPQAIARVNTPNTTFSNELRLDSRSGSPFKITGINVDARKDMQVVADVRPGEGGKFYVVAISGVTPSEQGMFTGFLTVTTESGESKEVLRIPFSAAVSVAIPAAVNRNN